MIAANNNADIFVSVHFNDDDDRTVQGTETWVHPNSTKDSKLLASSLLQKLVEVTGYRNRGVKSDNWGVLNPEIHKATTANCLIEISFMSDPNDEERLLTVDYQNNIAGGISQAIVEYIKRKSSIQLINPLFSTLPKGEVDA
jgi:N-acetylmuramoyl-L-alanine amidase